ncbi:uncharacterized protein G2W53_015405 [Senna tora]|uniref:Uncharacterized protein n=1 Tax=Senna tora TaxID=362788 RepID=A0A835C9V0_9FABA|nr:uncharacterized protein G2W53_015405 [Senna tora]
MRGQPCHDAIRYPHNCLCEVKIDDSSRSQESMLNNEGKDDDEEPQHHWPN